MGNKYKIIFDDSTKILYKYYYGPIILEDIYSSWDYAIAHSLIPKNTKGFILDYRNASIEINLNEHKGIADYYKQHLDVFRGQRIAIITQSVKDVAIPTLVETKDNEYMSHPFYTLDAAIQWVLS